MKTQYILIALSVALLLSSCSKPSDDQPYPDKPENFRKMFMVKRTDYLSMGIISSYYTIYGEDSVGHNIYAVGDSTKNGYTKWEYDVSGRLVKIVYHQLETSTLYDSIEITRPATGTFRWNYAEGTGNPVVAGTRDWTGFITDLGSSRRLVTINNDGTDPNLYYEKLYLNTYGGGDSSILKAAGDAPGTYNLKRELFYNSDHQPNTQVVTVGTSTSPVTTVTTSTITRDQHEHAYLHAFINRLHGSDMVWLSFSPYRSLNALTMGGDFTDRILLLNGSLLTMTTEQKTYNNGVLHSTNAMPSYQYTITYDLQGRILVSEEKRDNVLTAKTEFTYYE
jgi:hypothetical protein